MSVYFPVTNQESIMTKPSSAIAVVAHSKVSGILPIAGSTIALAIMLVMALTTTVMTMM